MKSSTGRGPSRLTRTLRALFAIIALGVGLAAWSGYTTSHDISVALGAPTPEQKAFFIAAADRPDIATFFKSLKPDERTTMAQNIGKHDDVRLVGLVAQCLGDFHTPARESLTESLKVLAKKYPEAVATELKRSGSFQQTGIQQALLAAGDSSIPLIVKQLEVGDARSNAINFLVSLGPKVAPYVLPTLQVKDRDTRLAAADVLSKVGAKAAVPGLTKGFTGATGDERLGYLTALAGIGAPDSEDLMVSVLRDPKVAIPARSQAALGLGRIQSPSAVRVLWSFAGDDDNELQNNVITALQIAGDRSLAKGLPGQTPSLLLAVAAEVKTTQSDALIRNFLLDVTLSHQASEAAKERSALVPNLVAALRSLPTTRGDLADGILEALTTTPEGLTSLRSMESDPTWGGLVWRRKLASGA
ncbi:MAG: HEAT repeat domain-containing protein [Fimbriimonas sp.]